MMNELSLNVHDVTENSVKAEADLIEISIIINQEKDLLTICIHDNGNGMDKEQLKKVTDPFYTTRTTRKVGLGIPFFKMAAEMTGGSFNIESTLSVGTKIEANFILSHIDRMPLGDINCTIHTLITFHPEIDFIYLYKFNHQEFILDTREIRSILIDIPFNTKEVSDFIKDYLETNKNLVDNGTLI